MVLRDEDNKVDIDVLVECFLRKLLLAGDINSITYYNALNELRKENGYGNFEQEK